MLALFESARALAEHVSVGITCDVIAKHLNQLIPSTLCVFYSYDATTDDLEAKYTTGEGASAVKGIRIDLGHRLSGWVAVNRRTISNSDPVLDLDDRARSISPPLSSSLSTPLILNDELIGVLTLYTRGVEAFSEGDRRVIEAVAAQIAYSFKRALDFEEMSRHPALIVSSDRDDRSFRRGPS